MSSKRLFRAFQFWAICALLVCSPIVPRAFAAEDIQVSPVDPLHLISAYDIHHDFRSTPTQGPKWLPFDKVVPEKARWKSLRLVGPRGGIASGMVIASHSCKAELTGSLTGKAGTIPIEKTRIRYATYNNLKAAYTKHSRGIWRPPGWHYQREIKKNGGKVPDGFNWWRHHRPYDLRSSPPDHGGIKPIWLTVDISRNVKPGKYRSLLKVADRMFPVELTVAPYVLPDAGEMVAYIGCMWSYDRLANHFKLKPWSPEHLEKVSEFHGYLRRLGSKVLVITTIADNYLKDKHSMLRFRKTAGGLVPDWTVVDTILERYIAEVCKPSHLVFHVWSQDIYGIMSNHSAHNGFKSIAPEEVRIPVTVIGKNDSLAIEKISPPYLPEHAALWQRIFKELNERLKKHGISKEALVLGDSADGRPRKATVEAFEKLGYNNWSCCSHGRGVVVPKKKGEEIVLGTGMRIGYWEPVHAPGMTPRKDGILGGWNAPFIHYSPIRNYLQPHDPLTQYRAMIDAAVVTGEVNQKALNALDLSKQIDRHAREYIMFGNSGAGLTRVPVLPGDHNNKALAKTFPGIIRGNPRYLLTPEKDRLQPTAKLLVLLEGRNETEARITLEKALIGQWLPAALENEVRAFLYKRSVILTRDGVYAASAALWGGNMFDSRYLGVADDWPAMATRLFDLAGKAQAFKPSTKQIAGRPGK